MENNLPPKKFPSSLVDDIRADLDGGKLSVDSSNNDVQLTIRSFQDPRRQLGVAQSRIYDPATGKHFYMLGRVKVLVD